MRNRSSAMPNAARAADRCGPDRSTSRITWRTGAPVSSARGSGEFSNATAHAAARRAASRLARPGVRSYDTTTSGTPKRRAAKTAGMLAYPPTDTTTCGAHRRNSVVAASRRTDHLRHEREVLPRHAALEADDVEEIVRVRRLGQQAGLDASLGTDVSDARCLMTAGDERIGHGQRGQDMSRGSTTGDHGEHGPHAHPSGCD